MIKNDNIIANPSSNPEMNNIPAELFEEVPNRDDLHDQAFETKPVSFLRDSFNRFAKNKASIVAAVIIFIIALYAIIVPEVMPTAHVSSSDYPNGFQDAYLSEVLPYCSWFKGTGFWDGTQTKTVSESDLVVYQNDDSNHPALVKIEGKNERIDKVAGQTQTTVAYTVRLDSYGIGVKRVELTQSQYDSLKAEDARRVENGERTIIKHLVDVDSYTESYREKLVADTDLGDTQISLIIRNMKSEYNQKANLYYQIKPTGSDDDPSSNTFVPVLDDNGNVIPIYKLNSDGSYAEPTISGGTYSLRVDYFDYLTFKNGFEPYFLFGTNTSGQDLFLRLAQGTRFSLILGIAISLINFIIGLIWGAISGYYGGWVDLTMERITDIISNIPSIIILTICGIQFQNNSALRASIGESGIIILAFLVAFVYSGWVGVAGTTRMQFYRFKGQEYVLASRTLGAKDRRLIFRHILPNAIGTLVTSSVLMIPSVIFSESTLSYLGIINFTTGNLSSIGTLLSEGQGTLQNTPHILLFPCVIISILMICFNLFGNGLRDAFNTSLKGADD